MSEKKSECPKCREYVRFEHMCDTAYGMPETYMAGSERFVCSNCKYRLSRQEANQLGLKFILEK